jgi:hypothetical protein
VLCTRAETATDVVFRKGKYCESLQDVAIVMFSNCSLLLLQDVTLLVLVPLANVALCSLVLVMVSELLVEVGVVD